MRLRWVTALLLVSPLRGWAAQPEIHYEPAPPWVQETPVSRDEPIPEYRVRDGIYVLLFDRQTRVRPTTVESFERSVQHIVSQPGVEPTSQVAIEFDPAYQELSIHSVRIHRGAQRLDALDPSRVTVLQRETDLEEGKFDGTHTATLFLEDVRVGDVVDYSFTRRGQNPVFGGRYLDYLWTAGRHSYHLLRFRLLWPSTRTLHVNGHGSGALPHTKQLGDSTEYIWSFEKTDPILPDSDLPEWFHWYPWIELSEFGTWEEVARWGASIFAPPPTLARSIRALVDEIAIKHPGKDERLLAALRFVQDEIRYLGIEIGPHSHRPHDPELVLRRRFGDCKDKSILLVSMLRALGIDADAALTNTELLTRVKEWHPNPYAFNHSIVRARLGDRVLWLDPTESYQRGGIDQLAWQVETTALTLREGVTDLESIRPERSRDPSVQIEYAFDADEYDAPASLTITTAYRGQSANEQRAYLKSHSREEIRAEYLGFYAGKYPTIEQMKDIEVKDRQAENVIRVTEFYSIPDFWESGEDGKRTATYFPMEIRSRISLPDTRSRKMPIAHAHPDHASLRIRAKLPFTLNSPPEKQLIEDSAFRLEYSKASRERRLELYYEYESLSDHVPPEGAPAHYEHIDEAWELLGYSVWMHPTASSSPVWSFIRAVSGILSLAFLVPVISSVAARRMYLRSRPLAAIRLARIAHWSGFVHFRPRLARAARAVKLALYRSLVGQFASAEALLTAALRRSVGGGRLGARVHAAALVAFATLRIRQRRHEEAMDYLRRADEASAGFQLHRLEQVNRILLTANVKANLGDPEGAADALSQAEKLGRGNRLVAYEAASTRAEMLEAQGDLAAARDRYARNLRNAEEVFGPDHFFTGHAVKDFAEFESRHGNEAASSLLRARALRGLARHLPEDSVDLAWLRGKPADPGSDIHQDPHRPARGRAPGGGGVVS